MSIDEVLKGTAEVMAAMGPAGASTEARVLAGAIVSLIGVVRLQEARIEALEKKGAQAERDAEHAAMRKAMDQ